MSNEAPTQTIDLDQADCLNLAHHMLPRQGDTKEQARSIRALRERLRFDGEVELITMQDGTFDLANEDERRPETVELTDGEVSILKQGLDEREEQGKIPTSAKYIDLLDEVEELIETTRTRYSDSDED